MPNFNEVNSNEINSNNIVSLGEVKGDSLLSHAPIGDSDLVIRNADDTQRRYTLSKADAEGGANAGSNLELYAYDNNDASLGVSLKVTRATGVVDFPKGLTGSHNGPSANTGGVYTEDDANRTLTGDEVVGGVAFNLNTASARVITLPSGADLVTALGFTPSAGTQLPDIVVRNAGAGAITFDASAVGANLLGAPSIASKSAIAKVYFN